MQKPHGGAAVFRITGARTGLTEDVRGRQRRYVISMSVRSLCVLLAVVLWNVSRPLAWLALVGGVLLPYAAVVIANAGRENAPDLPTTEAPPPVRPELPGTATPERDSTWTGSVGQPRDAGDDDAGAGAVVVEEPAAEGHGDAGAPFDTTVPLTTTASFGDTVYQGTILTSKDFGPVIPGNPDIGTSGSVLRQTADSAAGTAGHDGTTHPKEQ